METETRQLEEPAPARDEADWLIGHTFDRFVVRRVVGRGGMGLVVEAHDPGLDRLVALKLVLDRRAASSPGQRLLREARAMARLSHPNVVQVHEVGIAGGQVFIVMELVRGRTLSQWLASRPSQREVLGAFAAAGAALHAAHRSGLVHRDFKPSNVLVDDDGRVRVTDFGIALQLDGGAEPVDDEPAADAPAFRRRLADLTRTGAAIGTPRYMAPEQRAGGEVTPRSDQYAFCVSLWEALYGIHPFAEGDEPTAVARRAPPAADGMARGTVVDGNASTAIDASPARAKPSEPRSQDSRSGDPAAPPAIPRGASVPKWLQRVVVRGLAADPARRHPTMTALVDAISRDPARRVRRIALWGAATAVVAGAVAIAVAPREGASCAVGVDRADQIWSGAQRARMKAAFDASARPHAARSFERASASLEAWQRDWRAGYLAACDAKGAHSAQLVDRRMSCLDRKLDDVRATVELLVAGGGDAVDRAIEATASLPAVGPCADTDALLASVPPPESVATRATVAAIEARLDVARALRRLGRFAAGLEHARGALASAAATGYRPVEAEAMIVVGQLLVANADRSAMATLREAMHAAAAVGDQRRVVEAAAWLVQAMAQSSEPSPQTLEVAQLAEAIARHARPPVEDMVRLSSAIGQSHHVHGKPAFARTRFEAALALAERARGPDDPIVLASLDQLGSLARTEGRFAEAQKLLERVVASRERVSGKEHPDLADALANLGNVYRSQSKLAEAKALYDRALAIRIAALGPEHRSVATSYINLGAYHAEAGDGDKAAEHYARALALFEKTRGPAHADTGQAMSNLANAEEVRGNFARARELGERALAILEGAHGADHPLVANVTSNLGVVAQQQGRYDDARRLYERAARIAEKVYGPDHPDVADFIENVATTLQHQGKLAEAEAMLDRSLAVVEAAHGTEHPRMAMGLVNLANLRLARKDMARALDAARRALAIFEAKLGPDHLNTSYAHLIAGEALAGLGRASEAVPHVERALAVREAAKMPPAFLAEARFSLAKVATDRGRARSLATRALAEFAGADAKPQAAEVRAWLARH